MTQKYILYAHSEKLHTIRGCKCVHYIYIENWNSGWLNVESQ